MFFKVSLKKSKELYFYFAGSTIKITVIFISMKNLWIGIIVMVKNPVKQENINCLNNKYNLIKIIIY